MRLFDQVILALAIAGVVVCLLAPLAIVALVTTSSNSLQTSHSLQTTVGIGVIFRATARRLIQTGARGAIRAASSTVMRAFTRTFTRRFARVAIGLSMGAAGKRARDRSGGTSNVGNSDDSSDDNSDDNSDVESDVGELPDGSEAESQQSSTFALVAGFVVLGGSFIGATYAVDDATRAAFYGDFQFSHAALFVLSSFPVLVYAGLFWLAGAWWSTSVRCTTKLDGLLLQGYFAGAGSFLPMATDFMVDEGGRDGNSGRDGNGNGGRGKSDRAKSDRAKIAACGIGGLYALHLILLAADQQLQLPVLRFCSAVFLIYAFVNAFPIDPLGGHYVWQRSKLAWLALFAPILVSFFFSFPESLAGLV